MLSGMKKIKPDLKKLLNKKFLVPFVIITVIIVGGAGVYFFDKYQKTQKLLENPRQVSAEASEMLIKKVSKLMELPVEIPTIAIVSDINKLKSQPFFINAQNGDRVLIYQASKKAILYRPSTNKIIDVSTINVKDTVAVASVSAATPIKPQTVKIAVFNGTKTPGLAKSKGEILKSKFSSTEIVSTTNALGSYDKNLVIDLTGENKALASDIAKEIKGETGSLPEAETKPQADILVILGSTE